MTQTTMTTGSRAAASCWPSCRNTAAGSVALAGTWRPSVLQCTRLARGGPTSAYGSEHPPGDAQVHPEGLKG
jgi:putative component of membrane protein insertase Oxa1/YidC/SpoIIIJ protein YidD